MTQFVLFIHSCINKGLPSCSSHSPYYGSFLPEPWQRLLSSVAMFMESRGRLLAEASLVIAQDESGTHRIAPAHNSHPVRINVKTWRYMHGECLDPAGEDQHLHVHKGKDNTFVLATEASTSDYAWDNDFWLLVRSLPSIAPWLHATDKKNETNKLFAVTWGPWPSYIRLAVKSTLCTKNKLRTSKHVCFA